MDKENGKGAEGNSGSSKVSNPSDPTPLLDAASLFGAYWPRGDANSANAANLFGGGFGLPPHPSLPFGMLPPTSGRGMPSYPTSTAAAAAFSNAYTNTLSVAASQAASLGIPAASAAWWSMASHLAAQDYLARLQATGLNFPLGSPADLQYASLGLPPPSHHKSKGGSKGVPPLHKAKDALDGRLDATPKANSSMPNSKPKYPGAGLSVQSMKLPSDKKAKVNDLNYLKPMDKKTSVSSSARVTTSSPSIFTSPLSLASNFDKSANTISTQSSSDSISGAPTTSILSAALEGNSDPNSILGGVRLPPDTEIIKYTSSIVGPKIPGTTNRGRKKTISLDPPSVSVHPSHSSTGMLIERSNKRPKLTDQQDVSSPPSSANDRVEVIKLPATNGSPSGISVPSFNSSESTGDTPLNLSLKPSTSTNSTASSSLNSLCNMSANIGVDRISRRKPGPKPRRVVPSGGQMPPGAPSASLAQLFATADSPRPPSRNEGSDGGSSTSSTCTTTAPTTACTTVPSISNHKEGRPRNLGRGVSKPKKNTVASLLAQSRALGIKPMPILDPNASMNQQMNLLKSNILAAQQYISEAGGDEKALNKFLQEKFRGTLSDSSTVDASTDSDNLTDSNHTDSEMEIEVATKKQKQYDERALRVPLEKGWKRETVIRGLTKSGGLKGDVTYVAPDSANKFKQMSDVTQYLEYQKSTEFTKENFTFSCRVILGDYLQPVPPEMAAEAGEYIHLTEEDVNRRLEELKSAMRTSLPVEQRIEMARKQQAARAAARMDREQARLAKEIERSERQEAARRDREARSQQLLEGRKRLAFTLEQKIQIISEIEGGKTKSDVSRELGLASSTVATIWKNRDNILNAYSSENLGRSHSPNNNDLFIPDIAMAKRKRQEELEKHRHEEQQRKQQEREFKRQQAAIIKEQMYIQEISKQREMLYTVELERERRRQHMALVKALENRRKLEERERKKQQLLAEKQANKEKKMEQRKMELEILSELRKPCEDLELDQKPLPEYERIPGLKLPGKAFADILMVFEFLHNFGETLGFDMESLPTLDSLQQALMPNEHSSEAEEELFSVMTHLLVCAIEDPGIPNPARHTTILGQSLRQADITHANLSEILRIYLYANATGEVKALTGVHFERDREKRVADHHQNDNEMQQTSVGKNSQYYELLHENDTWKMSDMLKDKPFMALSPTCKAEILAFLCNELLQNKAVIRQIESSLESVAQQKKEKWLLDTKIRKLRMLHGRKVRSEAVEKAQKADGEAEGAVDSPSLHKDDLLDDEENEMSENESVGTQPEEEEDNKLSGEELGKKLEKLVKQSEAQLQSLNSSTHQLRASCFGQDRYWRRYWCLSKAGGVFVEAMESAEPEVLLEQTQFDQSTETINSLNDINKLMNNVENINDSNVDKEVSNIVGNNESTEEVEKSPVKTTDDNDNEHRKTPNRLGVFENGEILDKSERNLAELRKSVDDIVQNLERNIEIEKENKLKQESLNKLNNHVEEIKSEPGEPDSLANKKFNLFEKLGQCMERENKTEEDLKADVKAEVKEELKNEILNELKCDIKAESKTEIKSEDEKPAESEHKWFSVLNKEGTCEGIYLTAGNRWDNGVGACTRDNLTELKIPVFPPPGANSSNYHSLCDSPAPLQMTAEESAQLEHIKKHGMPKSCARKSVPVDKRYGWWRITDPDQLKEVLDNLHVRGARERELKRNFISIMQTMYERQGKFYIEDGQKDLTELALEGIESVKFMDGGAPHPDEPGAWSQSIAHRVDLFLLEQVEALEDKVASASMQIKGWKIPNRDTPEIPPNEVVPLVRERLSSLEVNIERRYLKPPLGVKPTCINIANVGEQTSTPGQESTSTATAQQAPDPNEIPKGLAVWREAVNRAQTSAQLAMCLYSLESSIAWDKSIMKANCQFCHSGDNEDKLLLCDGCDKGYHTYCFKPKMENIPEGDWYCHECMNKATGERNCIVCGKKSSTSGTRLILCELCPRAYHTDCIHPIMHKVPRGKWYCSKCISKKPQKKTMRKNHAKSSKDSELSDHPPSSPAPSHSSVTTNEEATNCNQSDVSNSSLGNAGSPSTQTCKKDRISKKLLKELAPCKTILEDLECHDDAWPFLLPVNTKQFPTYKKIIKTPMDLSTIKKKLYDVSYKSKEEFVLDVRQIFNNCEVFNEDDSPVGKAGHCMRQFFEARWNELSISNS
ncbi:bromodomain adjacent to zinc finger domain protein 2B isoform X4 [Tribolium castaneum]|uniref:bromodomain adjacent to zinc finger domain protein 2B isoform X4 n=1 Tax=Tribolium castaneum TaxID=7070 RepID=UPI00077DE7FB|nr:PREDICTED: bromodomain adjacent to zinc finger domain protein 2B isoform X4 [Tribolium castaneum]|eukprot:XP_015837092.1 PREDICTED: bromodomain adjacent to zinc finger domain protein 2B isoform X4 [Tribolium castaneum]